MKNRTQFLSTIIILNVFLQVAQKIDRHGKLITYFRRYMRTCELLMQKN